MGSKSSGMRFGEETETGVVKSLKEIEVEAAAEKSSSRKKQRQTQLRLLNVATQHILCHSSEGNGD